MRGRLLWAAAKILSLDLSALCEFAPLLKVEQSAIEGKGNVGVLTGDNHMEYVDEFIAHLCPPQLEGMEHEYGREELETKGDQKKKQGDLESKQQLAKEKLAKIKKEKPTDPVKDKGTINFPVKGVEQSIFHRAIKILGVVGERFGKHLLMMFRKFLPRLVFMLAFHGGFHFGCRLYVGL